jgi:DNA-binding protein WhiA
MSASSNLKTQLAGRKIYSNQSKFLCLYGMMITLRECSAAKILLKTENKSVKDLFCTLVDSVCGSVGSVKVETGDSKSMLYKLSVKAPTVRKKLINVYSFTPNHTTDGDNKIINRDIIDNVMIGDFFAGVFLACGNITEPEKGYHLELILPSEQIAKEIAEILAESYWENGSNIVKRRDRYVLYMKGVERIADFLTFIGLSDAAIDYLNTQIYKDVRNKANRIANCDAANIERAVSAGSRQMADIDVIYNAGKRETLSPVLRETADLRLENPDMTLAELAESFDPHVTRSCINHRLQKLSLIAEKIRHGT